MRAALAFLTVLPVGAGPAPGRAALAAFPLAGVVVGAAWLGAGLAGTAAGGALVGAGAVLAADLLVTGGLHLDGFADVADGLASRRPPVEAVEVVRDPRVGAVGAAAVTTVLLLRFALVAAVLPTHPLALIAAPAAGRAAMVWALGAVPDGSGSLTSGVRHSATGGVRAASGLLAWAVGVAALAGGATVSGVGGVAGGAVGGGVAAAAAALAVGVVVARRVSARLGVACGDTVGAAGLLGETAALAVLVAM